MNSSMVPTVSGAVGSSKLSTLAIGPYDVLVCGHSHLWELSQGEGPAFVNLGSITFPKGGKEPTFATYEFGLFTIYRLDGTPLQTMRL